MKEEFDKVMEKLRKMSGRNLGNTKFLKSNETINLKVIPADWNKWKTEFQGLKTK
jgi:hypothetical protein